MKLSDFPENKGIRGIANIKGKWEEIEGITKKGEIGTVLVIGDKIYNDPNIEIET